MTYPIPDPRNPHGEIKNPLPREPRPIKDRKNRDLSKCGNDLLPVRKSKGRAW